jgi:phage replication O-like protein O
MASPQLEDGYTKLSNELLEALGRIRVPGEAMQILLVIMRKTYGFQKKSDAIPLSQFYLATGIIKPSIIRALKILESMNLISKNANPQGVTYSINKDYSTWKPLAKKLTLAKKLINVSNNAKNRLLKSYPQKKKEKRNLTIFSSEVTELSNLLADKILSNNPKHRSLNGKKENTVLKWCDAIDKLHRIDKQSIEDIRLVIEWCQADSFWKQNILSSEKLRKNWDTIYPKAKASRKQSAWMEV